MSTNSISYHVIVDDLSDNQLNTIVNHCKITKPPYINIKGGERFDKAMRLTERFYHEVPETKVIIRRWPDDGLLKHFGYNAFVWYDNIIKPLENWLLTYKPIWLVDNESMEDDLTPYAQCSKDIMNIMGSKGLGVAVGRFAAGNPREHQYAQLKPMWEGLKQWFDLSIWSPNEYFDKPNKTSGSGSIFRYYLGWQWCKENLNFIPKTVIGEFGLALDYNPQKGFRTINLSQTAYADICYHYLKTYYAPYQVPVCLFSYGNWHGFEVDNSFLSYVENNRFIVDVIETPYKEDEKEMDNILDLLKDTILNRKFLVPLLTPIVAWLLLQIPGFPFTAEQVVEAVVAIVLALIGFDAVHDIANVAKGNVWNSRKHQWEKRV